MLAVPLSSRCWITYIAAARLSPNTRPGPPPCLPAGSAPHATYVRMTQLVSSAGTALSHPDGGTRQTGGEEALAPGSKAKLGADTADAPACCRISSSAVVCSKAVGRASARLALPAPRPRMSPHQNGQQHPSPPPSSPPPPPSPPPAASERSPPRLLSASSGTAVAMVLSVAAAHRGRSSDGAVCVRLSAASASRRVSPPSK
mmetsp:Transcript_7616/g.22610  ORF Transcript_7616/g.22610 Transcript_7616/m.22610 type:complete len:202 (-) Transcript_7616:7-612(-)